MNWRSRPANWMATAVRTKMALTSCRAPNVKGAHLVDLEAVVHKRSLMRSAARNHCDAGRVLKDPEGRNDVVCRSQFRKSDVWRQTDTKCYIPSKKEVAEILSALVLGKIFRHSAAEVYEFHEPLLRFNIRLLQESDRLQALADRARKANFASSDGDSKLEPVVVKRKQLTAKELEGQRALQAKNDFSMNSF